MLKKASGMIRHAARIAAPDARHKGMRAGSHETCTPRDAPIAAGNAWFPLSRAGTNRSIAANAFRGVNRNDLHKP